MELLNKIEHYIPQYGLEDIYERTFCNIIRLAQSEKNFKKNLRTIAEGQEAVVNYINGKNAAIKYLLMPSVCGKEIETIIWDIIDYIKSHQLTSQIDISIGKMRALWTSLLEDVLVIICLVILKPLEQFISALKSSLN